MKQRLEIQRKEAFASKVLHLIVDKVKEFNSRDIIWYLRKVLETENDRWFLTCGTTEDLWKAERIKEEQLRDLKNIRASIKTKNYEGFSKNKNKNLIWLGCTTKEGFIGK